MADDFIVERSAPILITGSNGFIGSKVVETLILYGFSHLRCFVRPSSDLRRLRPITSRADASSVEIIEGDLLSRSDCERAVENVSLIYHLAAGVEKTFAGCYMNSVVTTRNLLDACLSSDNLKRFVNVSSFSVYSNLSLKRGAILDESCPIESQFMERFDAYCFGKVKQDEIVADYGRNHGVPYVIVRPGAVYGPGVRQRIPPRVGIDTFGFFLHLGGQNKIPLSYIDNCAEAIVLAGLKPGIDGEAINVVDDALPKSRVFLKAYKNNVGHFWSVSVPYHVFYFFSVLWEKYSRYSRGQLPPTFNKYRCAVYWQGNAYSNDKLKLLLGWRMKVGYEEASRNYFAYLKETRQVRQ